MKQTNINIDEIKRYPTVTNPIKADDLHTPQAYAYTLRRAIVTDCNDRQRAELVKLLEGKESAEGVTFNNTKMNRDRLHIWQNRESRKQRAAILGEGWQYIEGLNHGTQPGDVVCCVDGTRGRVTKSDPESCCIEFETENGQRLSVAGYFRYTPSAKSETDAEKAFREALTINVGDRVTSKHYHTIGTVTGIRQEKGQTLYDVKFDKPVKSFWSDEMKDTGDFCRYAITKDYDPSTGCEREGTAIYYAEELQADYWQREPRTIFDIEIFKPTDRCPTWLVVADIFSEPKQATLYEICDYLAALYQENRKAA